VSIIKKLSGLGALLAVLGVVTAALAGVASPSTALIPLPGGTGAGPGGTGVVTSPEPVVRTVVVGGMPGWQIALIAVVAALVAAVAAVLADRIIRSARRRPLSEPA
jgi:hypothetical protein